MQKSTKTPGLAIRIQVSLKLLRGISESSCCMRTIRVQYETGLHRRPQ